MSRGRVRTLTPEEIRSFYDGFGAKQDSQLFYERPALDALIAHAELGRAESVLELGCGTGRFARELLDDQLAPTCRYLGVDVSGTMVRLATERLAPYSARASARLASGEPKPPAADASVDRVISTYVLDLLPHEVATRLVADAARALRPGGLLCLAGITDGTTVLSRVVMGAWKLLFALRPSWVGGCRPIRLVELLPAERWEIRFHDTVVAWGMASEVVVASVRSVSG
jgi:SAM-dependent methyltransferase